MSKRLKASKAMEQQQNGDSRAEESEGVVEETMDFEPEADSDSLTETNFDVNADDAVSVNEFNRTASSAFTSKLVSVGEH